MRPAPSIILFTTLSGAGYGLLLLMALGGLAGGLPTTFWLGLVGLGLALGLVTTGLLSSTLHLKHPERAWRAVTQWRSSWLSREGVAALLTYPPALLLAWGWLLDGEIWAAPALLTALGAAVTVYCTGQIYASLAPIALWHQPLTTPVYLAFALANGAVLLAALTHATGVPRAWAMIAGLLLLPVAWALKLAWWRQEPRSDATPESALGLFGFREVHLVEPPHTGSNYLLHEMVFSIARKHAAKLRRIAFLTGSLAAWALLLVALLAGAGWMALALAVLAAIAAFLGTLIERWLFFAEARHTVSLYYGAKAA